MRIYELAKKYKMTSKEMMAVLDRMDISYKTHSSSLDEKQAEAVRRELNGEERSVPASGKTGASKKPARPKSKHPDKPAPAKPKTPKKAAAKKETPTEPDLEELPGEDEPEEILSYEEKYEEKPVRKKPHRHQHAGEEDDSPEDSEKESATPSPAASGGPVRIVEGSNVKEFSELTGIPASDVIKKLFLLGVMASINQNLDRDTLLILADEFKISIDVAEPEEEQAESPSEGEEDSAQDFEDLLEVRPPVVTVMGHVNHGKTTLLDAVRKTKVVESESGGITQHIGAYMVEHNQAKICFIDTPGHAAFTSMRAMGANVTDIVILVVAANDSVQPQTIESIAHAREADVPVIIAINKTDAEGANIDKVKTDLMQHDITAEDWGGDNLCVNISALKGDGIDALLDAVNLQAELLELKANPQGKAFGIVLESCQTDKKGPLVTVLVKNGVFRVGDPVLCGHVYGKIKRMENERGEVLDEAFPSWPVRVFGFTGVPEIASRVKIISSEKEARSYAKTKSDQRRHNILKKKETVTLDNLYSSIQAEQKKDYKIILKADVVGSISAIRSLLSGISTEKIQLKIIQSTTGSVTDTDVTFAHAYNAKIIAYRVRVTASAQQLAKQYGVNIMEFDVIYRVYEIVHRSMEGLLDIEYGERAIGSCEVKKMFRIAKVGTVAGCLVTEGKVLRKALCRVIRDGQPLDVQARITSLKHYKDEVEEVRMGSECGIALEGFSDFQEGDKLEFHVLEKVTTTL
jgi:translation initiation factor IF-2